MNESWEGFRREERPLWSEMWILMVENQSHSDQSRSTWRWQPYLTVSPYTKRWQGLWNSCLLELSRFSANQQICYDASCIAAFDYGLKWCNRRETRVWFLATAGSSPQPLLWDCWGWGGVSLAMAAFCLRTCGTYIVVFMAEAREWRTKYRAHQRSKQSVQLSKKLMIMTVNECGQLTCCLGANRELRKKKEVLA